jgi:transcriptional antiterminator RfaH
MGGWAVVMTKPNCENLADINLRQQGYVSYLPRIRQRRLDGSVHIKPLFPRYLFTRIHTTWYSIRGTYGVTCLLMNENGPAFVPESVIDGIKSREENGFIAVQQTERFTKGQRLRALDGPLLGKYLTYDGITGRDRVRVLLSILGRQVQATLPERSLVAA